MAGNLGNIQETLFIPLWARAYTAKKYPRLLDDRESVRIVDESGYDFSRIETSEEYYTLAAAVRAANFDREIKAYLAEFPEATIVSIGCGLDTTFFRVDNGKLTWYDLDLPEIIRLRRKYVRTNERTRTIAQSCFDYSWTGQVDYNREKGVLFIVGGVFYYFKEDQVCDFLSTVAGRFPGGRMYFDSTSKAGLKISNRYVRKTGNTGAEMYFSLNGTKRYFAPFLSKIKVIADYPFYRNISLVKSWKWKTKLSMKFSDFFRMVKVTGLEFC